MPEPPTPPLTPTPSPSLPQRPAAFLQEADRWTPDPSSASLWECVCLPGWGPVPLRVLVQQRQWRLGVGCGCSAPSGKLGCAHPPSVQTSCTLTVPSRELAARPSLPTRLTFTRDPAEARAAQTTGPSGANTTDSDHRLPLDSCFSEWSWWGLY